MSLPRLSSFLPWVPGVLVVLLALSVARLDLDPVRLRQWSQVYPWFVFAATLLLAVRFHRSRLVASILALAVADRLLAAASGGVAVVGAVTLLLPLTLSLLAILHDRGLLTVPGLGQLLLVLVQPAAVGAALVLAPEDLARLLEPATHLLSSGWGILRSPLGLVWVGPTVVVVVVALWRRRTVEAGLVWALVAVFFALRQAPGSAQATLYLTSSALILGLSVVETSYAMAYRDELTGLAGRRALRAVMGELGRRFTIAMVDVDHFKRVNDRYGHEVGDQVLRMIATRLSQVSDGGRAFRYGGEEFTLVFPSRSRQEVLPLLEELRGDIAGTRFTLRGRDRRRGGPAKARSRARKRRRLKKGLAVTVSIGMAESGRRQLTPDEVLRAADRALYRAKRAGRNRISK